MELMAVHLILSFLIVFGSGCTTYKEAVAAPVKTTPVPAKSTSPTAADVRR
jgi:hypothetical protein